MLRDYLANGRQNEREIATAIRPCLEAFFRVAYPEHFPPGTLLGHFRRIAIEQEILSQPDINELQNILEYANQFHHDTNPTWESREISSTELDGFVKRTLTFTKLH